MFQELLIPETRLSQYQNLECKYISSIFNMQNHVCSIGNMIKDAMRKNGRFESLFL
jgi:hypothetical protein